MKPFDVYHGFDLYKINDTAYVAKNQNTTLTADNYHDIYATVYLHTA